MYWKSVFLFVWYEHQIILDRNLMSVRVVHGFSNWIQWGRLWIERLPMEEPHSHVQRTRYEIMHNVSIRMMIRNARETRNNCSWLLWKQQWNREEGRYWNLSYHSVLQERLPYTSLSSQIRSVDDTRGYGIWIVIIDWRTAMRSASWERKHSRNCQR